MSKATQHHNLHYTRDGFCDAMRDALGPASDPQGRGLLILRHLPDNSEPSTICGVVYVRKPSERPIVLNHCPWCLQRIRFDESDQPSFYIPPEKPQ